MHIAGTDKDEEPRDESEPVVSRILVLAEQSRHTPYSANLPSSLCAQIPRPSTEPGPAPGELDAMLAPLLQSWGQLHVRQKELLLRFLQTGNCMVEIDSLSEGGIKAFSGRVLFVDLNGLSGTPSLWLDTVHQAIPSEKIQAIRCREQDNKGD